MTITGLPSDEQASTGNVNKLKQKMEAAERASDAAVDAGAPLAECRRKEKAMHKAQSAYFAAIGKAEPTQVVL